MDGMECTAQQREASSKWEMTKRMDPITANRGIAPMRRRLSQAAKARAGALSRVSRMSQHSEEETSRSAREWEKKSSSCRYSTGPPRRWSWLAFRGPCMLRFRFRLRLRPSSSAWKKMIRAEWPETTHHCPLDIHEALTHFNSTSQPRRSRPLRLLLFQR
jgi:hypothetical protein